jgi:hypothetical protein
VQPGAALAHTPVGLLEHEKFATQKSSVGQLVASAGEELKTPSANTALKIVPIAINWTFRFAIMISILFDVFVSSITLSNEQLFYAC